MPTDTVVPTATDAATAIPTATATVFATIQQMQIVTSDGQNAADGLLVLVATALFWLLFALFLWLVIAFGLSAFRRLDRTFVGDLGLAAGLLLIAVTYIFVVK